MARIDSAQKSMEQMRRWLARTYPDLDIPAILATVQGDPRRVRAAASSNADDRIINLYSPHLIEQLGRLGAGRPYTGYEQYGIQTGLHEILHQEGPRYGDSPWSRFWEEGLAESVSADVAPGFARTLKYRPTPTQRFEDGSWSTPDNDFQFKPDTYGPNVRAVRGLSFNQALRQMPRGWEGLEDPGASPEAMDFRRALLAMSNQQRNRTIAKTQKRMRREREVPGYLPKTVQSVGKTVSAAAAIPRDPIAAAAQQVGRTVRAAGRSTPSAVKRRVNAHRSMF
jgi:hypothetical protein